MSRIVIDADRVPALPGARDAWARGIRTGGAERNATLPRAASSTGDGTLAATRALAIDPQTSGGLLVAVPAPRVAGRIFRSFPTASRSVESSRGKTYGLVLA